MENPIGKEDDFVEVGHLRQVLIETWAEWRRLKIILRYETEVVHKHMRYA